MMSRKTILNLTSRKKKDNMLVYTNSVAPRNPGNTTYTANAPVLTGGSANEYTFAWCATARYFIYASDKGSVYEEARRTASTCYMVGLKETIAVQISDNVPWQWRRLLFTTKNTQYTPAGSANPFADTSSGMRRLVSELGSTSQALLYDYLFDGTRGIDWNDPLTAKTDRQIAQILYDKTCTIASGNEGGVIRNYRRYHPFNKNLVYGDDETGNTEAYSPYSTVGRPGMGDVYVVDIIKPRVGSGAGNQMLWVPEATLYWHEK